MSAPAIRHPGEYRWETRLLAVVTLTLTALGVAMCYSTGAYLPQWFDEATQQLTGAVVGGVGFLVAARTDYHVWQRLARPLFYATVAGLVVIAIAAVLWPDPKAPALVSRFVPHLNGARRWIVVGPLTFQVSEALRFTLVIYLAMRAVELGKRIRDLRGGFLPLLVPVGAVVLLIRLQPNLSMAILVGLVGGIVLFTAGTRISHLVGVAALGGVMVALALASGFRSNRLEAFRQPAKDCAPKEQVCEALIGVGSGGVIGVGFGEGTQKLGHVPYLYSDMILSIIGEEFGLVGIGVTMALFAIFCWMGYRIAKTAPDPFGTFVAAGLTTTVGIAAFLHAAVVLQMIPATGLTLPFISAGRVSLIVYLFSAGVVVAIGRRRGRPARAA